MKKQGKKNVLLVLFGAIMLYIGAVYFVGRYTLPVTASAWVTSIYDHFLSVHNAIKSDVLFYLVIIGVNFAVYYFMWYRPRKAKKNKLEITTARKIFFLAVGLYSILLIVIPQLTVSATASDLWINFVDHFVSVKGAITSDFNFIALILVALFGLYRFMVHNPKLSK